MKEKIKPRKAGSVPEEESEENNVAHPETTGSTCEDTGASDLTQKLMAAFHEKPKEDPELQRRKEFDQTVRGFRKSFRQDVATGVKHQVGAVVNEVKHSVANIKETSKAKKKERDEGEPLDEA